MSTVVKNVIPRINRYNVYHILFGFLIIAFFLHRLILWIAPSLEPQPWEYLLRGGPEDIWYIFGDTKTIHQGDNPYSIWATGEATSKSISYLPLYNLIGQIPMIFGLTSFSEWADAMRLFNVVAELGIGILLYKIALERSRPYLGIFGSSLWFFNAITIKVWQIQQIDCIIIFFALWAIYFAERRQKLAEFLLGISIVRGKKPSKIKSKAYYCLYFM